MPTRTGGVGSVLVVAIAFVTACDLCDREEILACGEVTAGAPTRPERDRELTFVLPTFQGRASFDGGYNHLSVRDYGDHCTATLQVRDVLRRLPHERWLSYVDLSDGEVVPLCAWLYRVARVRPEELVMERVEANKGPLANLPSVAAYAVPENGTQELSGPDFGAELVRLHVLKTTAQTQRDSLPTATVRGSYFMHREGRPGSVGGYTDCPLEPRTIRAGDLVPVRDAALKVLRIVPPAPKTKLRGWVEFDTTPVKSARDRHPNDKD